MTATVHPVTENKAEVYYPSSDGEPMAETTIHVRAILLLYEALEDYLPADAFIAADLFWYWEEGNPHARRAPDVMVVKGVGRAERRSFFSWREQGARPCFIVEMASENTWREDLYEKHPEYARLGVQEYFIFDPEALYVRPALLGYRRNEHGVYEPLKADAEDRLRSEQLGLYLRPEERMLRLIDASTGQAIPTREERIEQERRRAEQERQRAEQERQRAEQERQRADRLQAMLDQMKKAEGPAPPSLE